MSSRTDFTNTIGIVPCAGLATRVQPLPCSKEIFPVGFHSNEGFLNQRPKVAVSYLLESMSTAGVSKIFFVIRKDKCDILNYIGNGAAYGLKTAYLAMDFSPGVPFTIDEARIFTGDNHVVFGFPDILIKPKEAFTHLLERKAETASDLVLGLFPATNSSKVDMVEIGSQQRILGVYPKPMESDLIYTWLIASWSPKFTKFLHWFLTKNSYARYHGKISPPKEELFLGHVINAAIQEGMTVQSTVIPNGKYVDIGTPTDMMRAVDGDFDDIVS